MSEQFIGERTNTLVFVRHIDVDTNTPEVNSDPLVDNLPDSANAVTSVALLNPEDTLRFHTIWNEVQGRFVDDPGTAVEQAGGLISEVVEQLTRMFAHEVSSLESQWNQGREVSTEELRQALLRYHTFFNRLVI